jgi:ribonuclease P protein component
VAAEAPTYGRLRRRSEFLAAAKGTRVNAAAFAIQAIRRPTSGEPRFGFTVTNKTGNAVERARIRRRVKEAVRTIQGLPVRDGHDYVFVARRDALTASFPDLSRQIVRGLAEVSARLDRKPREPTQTAPTEPMKAADRQ